MKILKAIASLGLLQTISHVLTEMEANGVSSLAEGRLIVSRETEARHARKQRALLSNPASHAIVYGPPVGCPVDGCSGFLEEYPRWEEEPDANGNPVSITIEKCEKCAFSRIKDGE